MRRRNRLLLSTVGLCGLVLFTILTWPASHTPFRFLNGRPPLAKSRMLVYEFRTESSQLIADAARELRDHGYEVRSKNSDGASLKAVNGTECIDVFRDARWRTTDDGSIGWLESDQPGWVTVVFWGR